MIISFADRATEELYILGKSKDFPSNILTRARRKMLLINAAKGINELRVPPGNRLELLQGDRSGQHSIRVNKNWRICFEWRDDGVYKVELNNHYD